MILTNMISCPHSHHFLWRWQIALYAASFSHSSEFNIRRKLPKQQDKPWEEGEDWEGWPWTCGQPVINRGQGSLETLAGREAFTSWSCISLNLLGDNPCLSLSTGTGRRTQVSLVWKDLERLSGRMVTESHLSSLSTLNVNVFPSPGKRKRSAE